MSKEGKTVLFNFVTTPRKNLKAYFALGKALLNAHKLKKSFGGIFVPISVFQE